MIVLFLPGFEFAYEYEIWKVIIGNLLYNENITAC
jgi:hypothetical protein